ncbi:MAG: TonB-dependent receptor [Muribaculaceae bacterium]|nr:TonB-dependent receptor [Muribaculaceae bacterium]
MKPIGKSSCRLKIWLCTLILVVGCPYVMAQSKNSNLTVSGTVTDENNETLIGVSVLLKGQSKIGTVTDLEGEYLLSGVPADGVLQFSYVGMDPVTVKVDGRSRIDVVMKTSSEMLDEVVAIGYGSVKKSDLTGSVASVKPEAITNTPANSVENLLQGRAAGLSINTSSQDPGAGSTVRIRGASSLNGSNSPLIVVDGFPLGDAGDLKQVNPADIVGIEVLKDASASAIYGSRGANGVIMIKTRKASEGKTTIIVRQQTTFSQKSTKLDLWRDPVLMATLDNESRINGGLEPLYIGKVSSTGIYYPSIEELMTTWDTNTRWDELTLRDTPVSNNTTASVTSSNDKTIFSLSANYYTDQGLFKHDNYQKYGYNLSVEHKIFSNFRILARNILSRNVRDDNGWLAYWRNPIFPVYDENGDYFLTNSSDFSHPVAISENQKKQSKGLDFISSGSFIWDILPYLTLTTQLNYKYGSSVSDSYYPKKYTEAGQFSGGQGNISNWEGHNLVSDTYANFSKDFGQHNLGAMLGFSYEYYMSRSLGATARGFVNEALGNENMGAGNPEQFGVSNGKEQTKLVSGMARINYTFDNRYLITATFRADGSSKFGKNNKWAYFPSAAVSWKAHQEEFIRSLNVFDELKFRLSYGVSGNQGINPYQTLSRYGNEKYYNNGTWVTTIGPGYVSGWTGQDGIYRVWSGIPNPDLKWESTGQFNVGVDMGFFNNRLRAGFDFYIKKTKNLLRQRNLSLSSGYDRMWVNDGNIENRGVELTLEGIIVNTNDWRLNGTLILSHNKNKITNLGNSLETGLITDSKTGMQFEYTGNNYEQYRDYINLLAIGQPINVFYGYKVDGIVQTLDEGIRAGLDGDYAQPGEFKYVDIDGDGSITENDKTIIGDPNPDLSMSLQLNLGWKNWDLGVFFNGEFGQDVYNTKAFGEPSNKPLRWTVDNPTNEYPSLRDGRQSMVSDWWVEDGSFLRIQNLTLGYTFNFKESWICDKIRIYGNVSNLYTFSKFKGYDPEVGLNGIYTGGYPRLRKWTIGVDFTF